MTIAERAQKNYWDDDNKCRTFFDEFAKEKNFNPLDPENWYALNVETMLRRKVRQPCISLGKVPIIA